jgi:hypothetical protein
VNPQDFRYKAFISYRHVPLDREWASWLIHQLETFRTPRALARKGVSPRVGRIFRDDDENSASGSLSISIREALNASEYLIVVCSPDTPGSQWVRNEIQYFHRLGRQNKVLVLLTAGNPLESFPPELQSLPGGRGHNTSRSLIDSDIEPIAADVRRRSDERKRTTRNRALLRLVASLLHVDFDQLVQRDRQRRVVRLRLRAAASVGALTILIGAVYGSISLFKFKNRQGADFIITEKMMASPRDADRLVQETESPVGILAFCAGQKNIGLANTTSKPVVLSIGEYQTDNVGDRAVLRPNNYYYFDAPTESSRWIISAGGKENTGGPDDPIALFVFDTKPCKPGQLAP